MYIKHVLEALKHDAHAKKACRRRRKSVFDREWTNNPTVAGY